MDSPAVTASDESNEIYVLKRGQILGPFSLQELKDGLAKGEFLPKDFVQQGGLPIWQPLIRFLDVSPLKLHGPVAPDWRSILAWVWIRLGQDVVAGSFLVGLVCTLVGTLVVALTYWPAGLWLPWFAIPISVALFAMKQGRAFAGLALLLIVAAVPVGFSFLSREADAPSRNRVAEVSEAPAPTSPEPVDNPDELPPVEIDSNSPSATPPAPAPIAGAGEPLPPATAPAPVPLPAPVAPVSPVNAIAAPVQTVAAVLPKELPPLPAPRASSEVGDAAAGTGDLVQRYSGALILVKASEGSGSGFVCKSDGKIRMYTNIHVVAGMKQPSFTALNGVSLTVALPEAAVGRDIFRTTVNAPPAAALDLIADLESTVKIGDDVVVLGNSGGGGVVTKLEGKLVGIGPDRIEVSAEFIPGNSGSPIIHVPTGRVIGIATYLSKRYEGFGSKGSSSTDSAVRRFGYRVDKVAQWQTVNWNLFQGEAEQLRRIELLTGDVFDFLGSVRKSSRSDFATETLRRPATQWLATINRAHLSPADRLQATRGFLSSLRAMVRGDVALAENQLRYDYFRNELSQQREVRDHLYDAFDEDLKRMTSTTGGLGY